MHLLRLGALALCSSTLWFGADAGVAAPPDQKSSCWTDAEYAGSQVCFDGHGRFLMSVFFQGAEGEAGHGADVSGRYWGSGNTIHFETEWEQGPWPWDHSQVNCKLGGPKGVMELTECKGAGRSSGQPKGDERDMTFHLVRSEAEALCATFEDLSSLPASFEEVGHATLMDGSHRYIYESPSCRCSDPWDTGSSHYVCEPIGAAAFTP